MDYEHEPEGIKNVRWKCPICRYEALRYSEGSLEQVKQDHLAGHDKADRIAIATEDVGTKHIPVGPKFSREDKKFLNAIGIKVDQREVDNGK